MAYTRSALAVIAVLSAGLAAGCSSVSLQHPAARKDMADVVIGNWSNYSRVSAAKLMDEYGVPDQVYAGRLVWLGRGPWTRITIMDRMSYYDSETGPDNLEQAVGYSVPADKRKALAAFSDRVRVSKDGSEISARTTSEELNFLTLNLADEVVRGARTPEEAQRFYDNTVQFALSGKSSRYMQGLLFLPLRGSP